MKIEAPQRYTKFVNADGIVENERINRFHEQIAEKINGGDRTASNGTIRARDGDCILADMSSGDVTVVMPDSGEVTVSREGSSNTLTLQGTISGDVNPEILYDNSTAHMKYFGGEWRYV